MAARTWGRTKKGRPLAPIGIAGGVVVGAAIGLLYFIANRGAQHAWATALAFGLVSVPLGFALIAAFIVDPTTMKGAVARPGESVEGQWLQKAGSFAFFTIMIVLSVFETVALFLPSLRDLHIHRDWLWGVVILGWASFGISYLVNKHRES